MSTVLCVLRPCLTVFTKREGVFHPYLPQHFAGFGRLSVDRKNEDKGEVTTDFALQHTLLCRLMVYSRVTTSAMAERCFLPVCWTLDISVERKGKLLELKFVAEEDSR